MRHFVIIGGGAAGLFAAGEALKNGYRVTVIEHSAAVGKKLLITGKGRCNVTNNCDEQTFLKNVLRNPRFMYSAIYSFNCADTVCFFENLGVPLKTERGRRVFPQSDKSADILNALLRNAEKASFVHGEAVEILTENGSAYGVRLADGSKITSDRILLATGGLSYPATGSTGDGYKMAAKLGHTVVPPVPSLVPLVEKGRDCVKMMGLSLKNVSLEIKENGKSIFKEQGEMLFTHFGISGPLVLSASAYITDFKKYNYTAIIDWKPALSEQELDRRLLRDFEEMKNKDAANSLDKLLPQKAIPVFVARWGIPPETKVNQITKQQRAELCGLLKHFEIPLSGFDKIDRAVITRGGVSVKEINPKTMQSKLVENLYFAGEIIDTDAFTGGYNLQIAFSTAYAAANAEQ